MSGPLIYSKADCVACFRTLLAGSGITITDDALTVTVAASGSSSGSAVGFHIVWRDIGASALFALPSDNNAGPTPLPAVDPAYHFVVARDCVLSSVHVKGSAAFGSINSVANSISDPFPVNVDLYLNGVYNTTLVTIPPAVTVFDLQASPGVSIPVGSDIQFVVDLGAWNSGTIGGMLVDAAFA